MVNEIKRNVIFNKPGGTASKGAIMARVTLPPDFVRALDITPDDKEIIIALKDNEIIIKKA